MPSAWSTASDARRRRRTVVLVTVLALLAAASALGARAWRLQAEAEAEGVERGRRLADGSDALPGRIAGHDSPLPPAATRCANCHPAGPGADTARPPLQAAVVGVASGAPALDRAALTTRQPRRNGPPSAYDAAALCRLLRTGVDPASVVVPTTMPRFTPTDAQCADLWAYLVTR